MNTNLPSDSSTMGGAVSGCLLICLLQLHVSHVLETVVLATSDATISFCGPATAKRADAYWRKGCRGLHSSAENYQLPTNTVDN